MNKHVDEWDLSLYPERDGDNVGSDRYRFQVLDASGMVQRHMVAVMEEKALTDAAGNTVIASVKVGDKALQPKRWDVTGAGSDRDEVMDLGVEKTVRWGIRGVDVRFAEQKIGGKPTLVQMGLWHNPTFNEDGEILEWVGVDRKKVLQPVAWRNVTEMYYAKNGWRDEAYKKNPDPYKNQTRPTTRMIELEMEQKATAKRIAQLEADNAKLIEKQNQKIIGNV